MGPQISSFFVLGLQVIKGYPVPFFVKKTFLEDYFAILIQCVPCSFRFFFTLKFFYQLLLDFNHKYIAINNIILFFFIRQNHIQAIVFSLHAIEF